MPISFETVISLAPMGPNSVHRVALCQIKTHYPLEKVIAAGQVIVSGSGQPDSGHHQQIVGDDAAQYILLEASPSRPLATIQAEGPLQGGDPRLDSGAEVAQHLVDPGALGHLDHGKSSLLGKDGVLDFAPLGKGKIIPGGKTAIGAHLTRHSAELFFVPFEQILITIAVGRVAPFDQAVQNQIGNAAGQKDLVPKLGIATPLDDDVGMILEKGNDLLGCGNLLPLDDATLRLVDDLPEDTDGPLKIMCQSKGGKPIRSFK